MFHLNKEKIFILYRFYLLEKEKKRKKFLKESSGKWLFDYLKKRDMIEKEIDENLKYHNFSNLPALEKAIISFASFELHDIKNHEYYKMIMDQVVNFSKVYLEENRYKYINKILDLLWGEIQNSIF